MNFRKVCVITENMKASYDLSDNLFCNLSKEDMDTFNIKRTKPGNRPKIVSDCGVIKFYSVHDAINYVLKGSRFDYICFQNWSYDIGARYLPIFDKQIKSNMFFDACQKLLKGEEVTL